MSISRIDLLNQNLPRAFRGYSRVAVDRLLQDMADTLGRYSDEKTTLAARVTQLEARLAEYRQREVALRDTLVASQRMSEEMKVNAQKEAQLILETARVKAEGLINQGATRLARIMEEIDAARKVRAQFEMKLRSTIEGHLRLMAMDAKEANELDAMTARLRQAVFSPAQAGDEADNG